MNEQEAYNLSELAAAYNHDKTSSKKAYEYFFELNKHYYHISVIREYEAFMERSPNSMSVDFADSTNEFEQKMHGQFEYAMDHVNHEVKGTNDAAYGFEKVFGDVIILLITLAGFYCIFLYFEPFKHAESL